MKTIQYFFLLFFIVAVQEMQSQEKPQWVVQQKIESQSDSYYGIGISQTSANDADARALIAFGQNVEVKVKSIFQREVTEEGKDFSENTKVTAELVSDVSLKGISITERYADTTAKTFYSLISYRKSEYDSLVTYEIQREILLMKARNKMTEEKREEELRAQKTKNLQEEEGKKESLRAQKTQIELKKQEQRQEEERKELCKKLYGEFLKEAPPEKIVSVRNAEIAHGTSVLLVKGGIAPLQFNGGYYALRFAMFEISGNAIFRDGKFNQQEAFAKIQILPGVGEFSKTSLAIGASQAVGMIIDSSYKFKRSKYSFFAAFNYTDPQWEYSTISVFADKRKAAIGLTTFPFYSQFKTHLGFVIEANAVFDKDFRNRYGDPIVVNGGVRLQANEDFSTQFAYENNEQFVLTFEFQF